ncbi:hypothetical protein AAG747_10545 [Rapidithrix thailandica]|uniref:Uncharacterized protein n=1 Tax=Rapidithrix thailandica TaxID=413964 RepID=A0AAW9S3A7_9BACT
MLNQKYTYIIFLLFTWLNTSQTGLAHPISVSWAEINVNSQKVEVKLRILAEDLFLYYGLASDQEDRIPVTTLNATAQKHKTFLQKYFQVRTGGRALRSNVTGIELLSSDIKAIAVSDLMEHSLYYHLEFPLTQAPSQLNFFQEFGGPANVINAIMLVQIKQKGVEVHLPFELKKGEHRSVRFDWSKAPTPQNTLSDKFARMKAKQQEETLGISSYSSVYSFIYITPFEVRHEILIPLATLETWLEIPRKDPMMLGVEEQSSALRKITDFFLRHQPIHVNQRQMQASVSRVDFYGLNFKDFAKRPEKQPLSTAHARVGIILSYPLREVPQSVQLTWGLFNKAVRKVNSIVYAFDDNLQAQFTRKSPQYTWKNAGRYSIQTISQVKAETESSWFSFFTGGEAPTEEQARKVFNTLLKNMYQAFDYRHEEQIYDALAISVSGELLSEVYLQIQKSLVMQEQGGAVSHIEEINITSGMQQNRSGENTSEQFNYFATWTVKGTVEHWGHIHERVNRYSALFTLKADDHTWKISKIQLLDQQREAFKTKIRQLWK